MKRTLYSKDIYFHNNFFDMVSDNPEEYEYDLIFHVGVLSLVHRKKLFDYLFKKMIQTNHNDVMLLKEKLIEKELYLEYTNSIISSNDSFLKTCLFLYFEPDLKGVLFENDEIILNSIINSNEQENLKLSIIFNLSQFACDEESYSKLKKSFKELFLKLNSDKSLEYKFKALEKYYDLMDKNQMLIGNEKVLKKKN